MKTMIRVALCVLGLLAAVMLLSCTARGLAPSAGGLEAPGGIRVHMSDLRPGGLRCLRCKGTGRLDGRPCPTCKGTGTMPSRSSALMPHVVPDDQPTSYGR